MNRKRVFAIALFILVGLFMYTFANPRENNDANSNESNSNVVDPTNVDDNNTTNNDVVDPTPVTPDEPVVPVVPNNQNVNPTPVVDPTNNNEEQTPVVPTPVEEPKDDLTDYKNAAKKEVEEYNKDVLYSEENQAIVDGIKDSAYNLIDNADSKDVIDQIVEDTKAAIDEIEKLINSTYVVKFYGFGGELLDEQTVKYNEDASYDDLEDVVINGITYSFTGWDKEFTEVKSNLDIYAQYEITEVIANVYVNNNNELSSLGTAKLNITTLLKAVIATNEDTTVANEDATIKAMVDGTLPNKPTEINKKYAYVALNYSVEEGFSIIANIVVDEEELARNTVILTYKADNGLFLHHNNQYIVSYESKTTNGKNTVSLPSVYKTVRTYSYPYFKYVKANVVWTDSEGNVVTNGKEYTKSTVLTAKIDKTGPVITLKGDIERTVYQTYGSYTEEGYTVTDNYTRMSTRDVTVSVTKDGYPVFGNRVDYNQLGKYIITYTAYDEDGNKGTATRTINVVKDYVTELTLSRNNDEYYVGDVATGVTVSAKYASGKTENVKTIYADTRTDGANKAIKVEFGGKDVTYTYTVLKVLPKEIKLSRNNDTYIIGESMKDVKVTLVYNNGKTETIYNYSRTAFDNQTVGANKVTYTYGTLEPVDYNYTVIKGESLTIPATKGNYVIGLDTKMDVFDVTITYSDGSTKTVKSDTCSVTGFDITTPVNDKKATINCDGATATYKYDVKYRVTIYGDYWYNDFYLEFTLPSGSNVEQVKYYDGKGNVYTFKPNTKHGKIVDLTKALYESMETMNGTNSNQKLEVKYKIKGSRLTSTYTQVVKSN